MIAKASDAVLSRAFRELGLKSTVLGQRSDSADVLAESKYYGYTLVADAKAFRLSRTARNQKDFKVTALSGWRKDADYAVLCSPYFQYPVKKSQIYAQAVDENVCLFSWEHLMFLLDNKVEETAKVSLSEIWNASGKYADCCVVSEKKRCFLPEINKIVFDIAKSNAADFEKFLKKCCNNISCRAAEETSFGEDEITKISSYTKEQAITELIRTKKINEKIARIRAYVAGIKK